MVVIDSSKHSDDSVAMKHFKSPTKESCSPSEADDTKALIQPSQCSPLVNISGPLDHSSPKRQWDRLYPDRLQSSSQLTHSRSRESLCSIRRASSVHDIEGFSVHPKNIFRDRHASEGMFNFFLKMEIFFNWVMKVYFYNVSKLNSNLLLQRRNVIKSY